MTVVAEPLQLSAEDAERLEAAFLGGLDEAQYAYERIVEARAWTALGFDTFGAWWDERVRPAMRALSMRPTREIAAAVVDQVRSEEADLPQAQRRTQRELAEMVGKSEATVGRLNGTRSTPATNVARTDLEPEPVAMPGRQQDADEILAQLDDRTASRIKQANDIVDSYRSLREDLQAIPPDRLAEIEESVRPAVQFGQLVAVCRDFVERLAAVDMGYAARGIDHTRTSPIHQAVERLNLLRQTLGEIA